MVGGSLAIGQSELDGRRWGPLAHQRTGQRRFPAPGKATDHDAGLPGERETPVITPLIEPQIRVSDVRMVIGARWRVGHHVGDGQRIGTKATDDETARAWLGHGDPGATPRVGDVGGAVLEFGPADTGDRLDPGDQAVSIGADPDPGNPDHVPPFAAPDGWHDTADAGTGTVPDQVGDVPVLIGKIEIPAEGTPPDPVPDRPRVVGLNRSRGTDEPGHDVHRGDREHDGQDQTELDTGMPGQSDHHDGGTGQEQTSTAVTTFQGGDHRQDQGHRSGHEQPKDSYDHDCLPRIAATRSAAVPGSLTWICSCWPPLMADWWLFSSVRKVAVALIARDRWGAQSISGAWR